MYRILTENKNVDQIKETLRALGLDYTIFFGEGAFHEQEEPSLVIELDNIPSSAATNAAILIREMNQQEAVLLQEIPVISQFI